MALETTDDYARALEEQGAIREENPTVTGVDGTKRTFRVRRKKRAQIRENHRRENPGRSTALLIQSLRF